MTTHACRRCSAKGQIQAFAHVKGGVCFRCWGTTLDLPDIEAELRQNLQKLRQEWCQARRAGASAEVLKKIEVRGLQARRALELQLIDTAAQRAKFVQASP